MKMKKLALALATAACALSLTGCFAAATAPATGLIYTSAAAPVTATASETGSKTGEATVSSILGLFATGDASIATAAKNGGITKIKTVDYKAFSVLGIYATYTVVVTGE